MELIHLKVQADQNTLASTQMVDLASVKLHQMHHFILVQIREGAKYVYEEVILHLILMIMEEFILKAVVMY